MTQPIYSPDYEEFEKLAAHGNLVPVHRDILADLETPVSAFLKIDDGGDAFLLESVEGGETWGRYSFIGVAPQMIFTTRGHTVEEICGRESPAPSVTHLRLKDVRTGAVSERYRSLSCFHTLDPLFLSSAWTASVSSTT